MSWSPFHTRIVAGLGAAWILDGLQNRIASSVTGVLVQPDTLDMTSTDVVERERGEPGTEALTTTADRPPPELPPAAVTP